MVRTQIQLAETQVALLKNMASAQHKSMAAIIRQAVDFFAHAHELGEKKRRRQKAMQSVGRFGSGLKDLASSHDDYLAKSFDK